MKKLIVTTLLCAVTVFGLTFSAPAASAEVKPGLYRACATVVLGKPARGVCRVLTLRQFIAELRSANVFGVGFGPLVSTPYGGYLPLRGPGTKGKRYEFRATSNGYRALSIGAIPGYGTEYQLTRLR